VPTNTFAIASADVSKCHLSHNASNKLLNQPLLAVEKILLVVVLSTILAGQAWALDGNVPGIFGDVSQFFLGDGTGVVIGIVDSGVDDTHPALTGTASLLQPRMVAEANFVTTEPLNTAV